MIYPNYISVKPAEPKSAFPAPLPREHGAWGLLLQPFVGGALLAGVWSWFYLPALGLALFGFLLREPLVVFVRQKYLWKRETEQTQLAGRWILGTGIGAAVCAILLVPVYPAWALFLLLGLGGLMTAVAVSLTIQNRQRSIALQLASAIGLTGTVWLAALAAGDAMNPNTWLLWVLLAGHAIAAIPVVHARLKRKSKAPDAERFAQIAWGIQGAGLIVALILWLSVPGLWIPVAFSAMGNLIEMKWSSKSSALNEPLKRLGLRLLGVSILHTLVAVAVVSRLTH